MPDRSDPGSQPYPQDAMSKPKKETTDKATLDPHERMWPDLHVAHYLDETRCHAYPIGVINAAIDTGYDDRRLSVARRFRVLTIPSTSGKADTYRRLLVIVGGRYEGDYSVRLEPSASLDSYLKALPLEYDGAESASGNIGLLTKAGVLAEVVSYSTIERLEEFRYPLKPSSYGQMGISFAFYRSNTIIEAKCTNAM